jgi:gas vesicle protein
MHYEQNSRAFNFMVGMVLGLAIGTGVALLTAPGSGRRTRRRLVNAVSDAREELGERWDDLSREVRSAVGSGRRYLHL